MYISLVFASLISLLQDEDTLALRKVTMTSYIYSNNSYFSANPWPGQPIFQLQLCSATESPVTALLILLLGGVSWYRSLVAFDRRWPARIGCSGVFFVFWLSQPFINPVSKFPMTKRSLAKHQDSLISHEPCSGNSTKRSYPNISHRLHKC